MANSIDLINEYKKILRDRPLRNREDAIIELIANRWQLDLDKIDNMQKEIENLKETISIKRNIIINLLKELNNGGIMK